MEGMALPLFEHIRCSVENTGGGVSESAFKQLFQTAKVCETFQALTVQVSSLATHRGEISVVGDDAIILIREEIREMEKRKRTTPA